MSDREQRDRRKVEIGERLRLFIEDPIIEEWFKQAKDKQLAAMVQADVADDDKRRAAALQYRTLDELWSFMQRAISESRRAAESIEARDTQKRDDA